MSEAIQTDLVSHQQDPQEAWVLFASPNHYLGSTKLALPRRTSVRRSSNSEGDAECSKPLSKQISIKYK